MTHGDWGFALANVEREPMRMLRIVQACLESPDWHPELVGVGMAEARVSEAALGYVTHREVDFTLDHPTFCFADLQAVCTEREDSWEWSKVQCDIHVHGGLDGHRFGRFDCTVVDGAVSVQLVGTSPSEEGSG